MKKAVSLFLSIIIIGCMFCACGSTARFEGNWACENAPNGYPGQMSLKGDGTGIADGFSCNWREQDGEFVLVLSLYGKLAYKYHFEGSTLYLDDYKYVRK